MTHDDLMRLAYEAGAKDHPNPDQWGILTISHDDIERLAAFIMLYEREECAKVCEAGIVQTNYLDASDWNESCENRAAAIRARGKE